jgi:hypothetical protein
MHTHAHILIHAVVPEETFTHTYIHIRIHTYSRCLSLTRETGRNIDIYIHTYTHTYIQSVPLFDDQWKEKQEDFFSKWINFLFKENNLTDAVEEQTDARPEHANANIPQNAYMALSMRRRDDRARWRVAAVWESAELRPVLYKLDKEVEFDRDLIGFVLFGSVSGFLRMYTWT